MAPTSHIGKTSAKSRSDASSTVVAPLTSFRRTALTRSGARTTTIAIRPSSRTITVFATCLPCTWAEAAISCAVNAGECRSDSNATWFSSRNFRNRSTGMVSLLIGIPYPDPTLLREVPRGP